MKKYRESHKPILRIFRIHKIINRGGYPTSGYLSKEFRVSKSTIYKDIGRLRSGFGAPICYDSTHNGYIYTKPFSLDFSDSPKEDSLIAAALTFSIMPLLTDSNPAGSFSDLLLNFFDSVISKQEFGSAVSSINILGINTKQNWNVLFTAIKGSVEQRTVSFLQIHNHDRYLIWVKIYKVVYYENKWIALGFHNETDEQDAWELNSFESATLTGKTFQKDEIHQNKIANTLQILSETTDPQKAFHNKKLPT